MNIFRALILPVLLAVPLAAQSFNPAGWTGHKALMITETAGIDRDHDPIDVWFTLPYQATVATAALRLVRETGTTLTEVPAQFYELHSGPNSSLVGKVAFLCPMQANEKKSFRLYFGQAAAGFGRYKSNLSIRPAERGPIDGPMHWTIENDFYRIETYPKNGQIWHFWDKQAANRIWWFKEWNGLEKGGDPVDWSPNVWVAYPDRVNFDRAVPEDRKKRFTQPFDWHYAVGWVQPKTEIIEGPVFYQIKRWGPLPPHPEHTDYTYERPAKDIVYAEVTYRFYAGLPWYFQSSKLITLEDMNVYFIRNSQMVFRDQIFTHIAIRPETPGLRSGDRDETCVLPLMSTFNRMPFGQGHSLSNILPSKFGYYTLFNTQNGDAYANFPLLEKNSTTTGGEPTMRNHAMSLSEGHDWTVYFARTFNYTNFRFNPENTTFLPKGQQFEEENIHLIYHYEGPKSLDTLEHLHDAFKHPLVVQWASTR